ALAEAAELFEQLRQAPDLQVATGVDAEQLHLARRDLADARDAPYWQPVHEFIHGSGRDGELAVRLAPVAGHLGEELVRRDTGRDGDADVLAHTAADLGGHARRAALAGLTVADVEVGLVQRERFDQV